MKRIFTILFLVILQNGFAQDIVINENEINKENVDVYINSAAKHKNGDSIYFYYNRAMLIAQKIDYSEGQVKACEGLIDFYKDDQEIYEKLRYSLLLVGLQNKYGTSDEKATAYSNLGRIYFKEKLFSKSAEMYSRAAALDVKDESLFYDVHVWLIRSQRHSGEIDEALVTAVKMEVKSDLSLYHQIELQKEKAEIYHDLKAFKKELESYKNILSLIKNSKYAYLESTTWNNIGYTNKYLNKNAEAKSAFYSAIRKGTNSDNELLGAAYYNLGLIFYNDRNKDSSLICFGKAQGHFKAIDNHEQHAKSLNMESMVYYKENDQYNAQEKVNEAIQMAKQYNLPSVLARCYEIESFILQDLFEFELALESYKKFLSIRDSLLSEERSLENKLMFDQYKVEQIEKQLRLIWAQNEMDLISLAKEKAEKEAERERFKTKQKEDELHIAALKNKAREALQTLILNEERQNLENKKKELALTQRDNKLKELALEKERLIVSENEKEIRLLAQQNEIDQQKHLNEEQQYKNNLRLVFGALLFIGLILIGILIAYRQLRKRKKRIEQQNVIIEQSRKEIEKEKEKSEGLLLNILPTAIAEELKAHGSAKPKLYDEVSVGFTDFSGFTMISEKLSPEELVEKLDTIFYEFDVIIERYGLQRIKTIGDAYMFASGLPELMPRHADLIVEAALDMRDFIQKYNDALPESSPKWNIRIGVNTGSVVAGVIGIKKFAYDIWGDTVNTAARMESSGEIGRVNISGSTYQLIKDNFTTEYRGKVAAKNKGEIDMYFVERKS